MSLISQLPAVSRRRRKRIGRGYGSGKGGHTASRGQKGQKSRNGGKTALWFEGGQLPLIKRLPMLRGKLRLRPVRLVYEVRLDELSHLEAKKITLDTLKIAKLVPAKAARAKVIATGKLTRSIELVGIQATARAEDLIKKAGGKLSS